MLEKIHIRICILAAAVVTAVSIINKVSLVKWAYWSIIAIVLFYVIGLVTKFYLQKNVFPKPEEPLVADSKGSEVMDDLKQRLNDSREKELIKKAQTTDDNDHILGYPDSGLEQSEAENEPAASL